jgi:hypothetical protein
LRLEPPAETGGVLRKANRKSLSVQAAFEWPSLAWSRHACLAAHTATLAASGSRFDTLVGNQLRAWALQFRCGRNRRSIAGFCRLPRLRPDLPRAPGFCRRPRSPASRLSRRFHPPFALVPFRAARKLQSQPNFASSRRAEDEFPIYFESSVPRLAPRGDSPTSIVPIIFLRGRKPG